jgi:hypothetical protein
MRRIAPLLLTTALVCSAAERAAASPASSGLYTEAGIGATTFLGPNASYAAVGPSFDLRGGYDLFSWLSVGLRMSGSSHEATVPAPPEGEYFQLYSGHAEGRLGFLWRRLGVFADGSAGVTMISSNVLERVQILDPGEQFTLSVSAGGGIEYQLVNRHHAFGISGQWTVLPEFDAMSHVTARAYFRYTY